MSDTFESIYMCVGHFYSIIVYLSSIMFYVVVGAIGLD